MREAQHLFAYFDDRGIDRDRGTGHQFALVLKVLLDGRHAALPVTQVRRVEAEPREQLPRGLVEFADIPHDIHVAHVVAMPRVYRTLISDLLLHAISSL